MSTEAEVPTYTSYPDLWRLSGEPESQILHDFLRWIVEDDQRVASAAEAMRWLPVGFFVLPLAQRVNSETGVAEETLQINLYHEDHPGNEHPHSHGRDAHTVWYAEPGTRQHITRVMLLPEGGIPPTRPNESERKLVANSIIPHDAGGRPIYTGLTVGQRNTLELSQSHVAPLGSQEFGSLEIHYVSMTGDGVALSTHYKGAEEPTEFNSFEGLMRYKGLTSQEAQLVTDQRSQLAIGLSEEQRLGPTSLILPPLDFNVDELHIAPTKPTEEVAQKLLLGGLATTEKLIKLS